MGILSNNINGYYIYIYNIIIFSIIILYMASNNPRVVPVLSKHSNLTQDELIRLVDECMQLYDLLENNIESYNQQRGNEMQKADIRREIIDIVRRYVDNYNHLNRDHRSTILKLTPEIISIVGNAISIPLELQETSMAATPVAPPRPAATPAAAPRPAPRPAAAAAAAYAEDDPRNAPVNFSPRNTGETIITVLISAGPVLGARHDSPYPFERYYYRLWRNAVTSGYNSPAFNYYIDNVTRFRDFISMARLNPLNNGFNEAAAEEHFRINSPNSPRIEIGRAIALINGSTNEPGAAGTARQSAVPAAPAASTRQPAARIDKALTEYTTLEQVFDTLRCPVCFENEIKIIYRCGHGVCFRCDDRISKSVDLNKCPNCRGPTIDSRRLYLSDGASANNKYLKYKTKYLQLKKQL